MPLILRPETEKGFLDALRQYAHLMGWRTYHTLTSQGSEAGFPDVVLARPGDAVLFAELKTVRGRVTSAQQDWLTVLGQVETVETYLWRPNNWACIEERLRLR